MFFSIDRQATTSMQEQLRSKIVAAILQGQLPSGATLPSTRTLATTLKISRTTVVLVYEKLVEDGFLVSADRSGFTVRADASPLQDRMRSEPQTPQDTADPVNWQIRLRITPGQQRNISKPQNWQNYKYPFVYGQPDPSLFPLSVWRECSRQAMSELAMRDWSSDAIAEDDPYLIQEIKSKLLPKRGIFAHEDEILITLGSQNAVFLIASLLMDPTTKVGMEDPGYPDARNILEITGAQLHPLRIDQEGAVINEATQDCDYVFLTPSHQSPTTISMSDERKSDFRSLASTNDVILIEDDFESETNYLGNPSRAMKADDSHGRILYVGSLSKSMFPGLRLGYIVAPSKLIAELRALRRLMLRHAPANNQRTTALFISQGHHDTYIRKLNRTYHTRFQAMKSGLDSYLPGMTIDPTFGGTSFWLKGPQNLNSENLGYQALMRSIVIEPGTPFFLDPTQNRNFFRLGFSSIPTDRIKQGLLELSHLMT